MPPPPLSPSDQVHHEGGRVRLPHVPPATGGGNGHVRGLQTLLGCAGVSIEYERLMGLSGLAFILQVDTGHRWEGQVDAGWWPLDPWGLERSREFLSRAVGYELKETGPFFDSQRWVMPVGERRDAYMEQIHPEVVRQIDAGRPALAPFGPSKADFGYVITGYDKDGVADRLPIWGRCATESAEGRYGYCADWPFGVLTLGRRLDPMDADEADRAALRQAVALARDQAGPAEAPWRDQRFTGGRAWAAWASLLRQAEETVESRHHANVRGHLVANRTAAVTYLRSVAERRKGPTADALRDAADAYAKVVEQARLLDVQDIAKSMEKRRHLADHIDRIARLEQGAVAHLERAVDAMK